MAETGPTVKGIPSSNGTIKSSVPWINKVGTLSEAVIQLVSPIALHKPITPAILTGWL